MKVPDTDWFQQPREVQVYLSDAGVADGVGILATAAIDPDTDDSQSRPRLWLRSLIAPAPTMKAFRSGCNKITAMNLTIQSREDHDSFRRTYRALGLRLGGTYNSAGLEVLEFALMVLLPDLPEPSPEKSELPPTTVSVDVERLKAVNAWAEANPGRAALEFVVHTPAGVVGPYGSIEAARKAIDKQISKWTDRSTIASQFSFRANEKLYLEDQTKVQESVKHPPDNLMESVLVTEIQELKTLCNRQAAQIKDLLGGLDVRVAQNATQLIVGGIHLVHRSDNLIVLDCDTIAKRVEFEGIGGDSEYPDQIEVCLGGDQTTPMAGWQASIFLTLPPQTENRWQCAVARTGKYNIVITLYRYRSLGDLPLLFDERRNDPKPSPGETKTHDPS